jgi:hypothetical protein
MKQGTDKIELKIIYLTDDLNVLKVSLRRSAQVGACVLGIFRLIFRERFDLAGLSDALERVRKGL